MRGFMRIFLIALISIVSITVNLSAQDLSAQDKTVIVKRPKLQFADSSFLPKHNTRLWNSVNVGLSYNIFLKFKKTENPNRPQVSAFVWRDLLNDMTSGNLGTWLGYKKLNCLNTDPIELDREDGNLYLNGKVIGFWFEHPNHKSEFIQSGFRITAELVINEDLNTIEIKP